MQNTSFYFMYGFIIFNTHLTNSIGVVSVAEVIHRENVGIIRL